MSFNIASEDLRSIKTERALYSTIFSLLKKTSFKKITVKGICEDALISRAAFYAHFIDKYDLLKHWLEELWSKSFKIISTYEDLEKTVNEHLYQNTRILKNLTDEVDYETTKILYEFILSTKPKNIARKGEVCHKNVVLSNFYAGGIISYFLWQIQNNFPSDVPLMNKDFYQMIKKFQD